MNPIEDCPANRLCDAIMEVMNQELNRMRATNEIDSFQLLLGPLLATLSYIDGGPNNKPKEIVAIEDAIKNLIKSRNKTASLIRVPPPEHRSDIVN